MPIALLPVMQLCIKGLLPWIVLSTAIACGDPAAVDPTSEPTVVGGKADRFDTAPELPLLFERKLEKILDHPDTERFEASGVAVRGDRILIVFDNLRRFASVDVDLADGHWLGDRDGYGLHADSRVADTRDFAGFEGITVDRATGRVSMAIEGMVTVDRDVLPAIVHWTEHSAELEWLEHEVQDLNKGVEGLAFLEVDGRRWLAALCETGKCDTRTRGRLILRDERGELSHVDLPKGLGFEDFSGLAIDGSRLAVVSQETSRVWIGEAVYDEDGELDLVTEQVFNLPRQRDGDVDFCTVEGLAWLDPETLVAVSDLEKKGQPERCNNHAERIHFFDVPR